MLKKVAIGLDIGSSAVRAAEVHIDGSRRTLRHFAQVGLPPGSVVEGEVVDKAVVVQAIRRLWQHGNFSSKKVVVGLGSQRALVRQVEMPAMSDSELKSALRFKSGEFLPIPIEQAVVDFAPLPNAPGAEAGRRVLLVAAQRTVVSDEVDVATAAGLKVMGVDSSALALTRAIGASTVERGTGALDAIVGIGSELITVAVCEEGIPRFVRTVTLGGHGSNVTSNEAFQTTPRSDESQRRPSRPPLSGTGADRHLASVVNEVRGSIEYLLSQSRNERVGRVLVTGGGAMLPGVTTALGNALGLPVTIAQAHVDVDKTSLGIDDAAISEAEFRWLTSVGLALWGTDVYGAPSLLPPEVAEKEKERRLLMAAAVGGVAVLAALGAVSFTKVHTASNLNASIATSNQQAQVLQQKIGQLGYLTKLPGEVQAQRSLATAALGGDIDWPSLVDRMLSAMPKDVTPQSLVFSKNETPTGGPATGNVIGEVSITAKTSGGAKAVAEFIDRLSQVKGIQALWVSSTTGGGTTAETITAAAQITTGAFSNRIATLPGGGS